MGLILEKKKLTRDDKFFWTAQRIGGWIYDMFFMNNKMVSTIPFYDMYKTYLIVKTRVNVNNPEAVLDSLKTEYEPFLSLMEPQKSEDVIDEFKKNYPVIKEKIDRYGKKEANPNERRGRKRMEKKRNVTSAIVKGRTDVDMSRLRPLSAVKSEPVVEPTVEPVNEPTPESGKRGRKKLDRDFTPTEAGRWKLEGIEQLEKIERRIDKYEAQSTKLTNEIIRLQRELDRRRSFFGINNNDADDLNESIEQIKSDFKRFIF